MARTKFYLDTRSARADGSSALRLSVSHEGRSMLLSVEGVSLQPRQWDAAAGRVVAHPLAARLNSIITRFRLEVDDKLLELQQCGRLVGMPMAKLREALTGKVRGGGRGVGSFYRAFVEFAGSRRAEGTRLVYGQTMRRIVAYVGVEAARGLTFEMITREWLRGFEEFLARTSPSANARGIHLRNIRAVFNHAIDEELTELYPFRRFKIKSQPTRKRSLPVEALRELFSLDVEPWQQRYLDFFKLSFFLCGINIGDLCKLTGIAYGRVEYCRAKTGKPYSIKVEPEAMAIIERYRGTGLPPAKLVKRLEMCKRMAWKLRKRADKAARPLCTALLFQSGTGALHTTRPDNGGGDYRIEAAEYTTKRGKVLEMHLVTFGRELSKEERQALTKFAKDNKGWWDREKGGFMMRDEASARALGEMLGDGEAIADNQPLSLADVLAVNDGGARRCRGGRGTKRRGRFAHDSGRRRCGAVYNGDKAAGPLCTRLARHGQHGQTAEL